MTTTSTSDTPEWFLHYFQQQVAGNPANPKWLVGASAAEQWSSYHLDRSNNPTERLCTLVQLLMPYRFEGSGFYALWDTLLRHLSSLPPNAQLPVWQTIFDPAHHGERNIVFSDQAQMVIQQWCYQAELTDLSRDEVQKFITLVVPYFFASLANEWLALVRAIDSWIAAMPSHITFFQAVVEAHNQHIQPGR